MEVTALLTRSVDAWIIHVPEVPGGFALAPSLAVVPTVAAATAATISGLPAESIRVNLRHR